jgi:putative transposase
MNKLGTSYSMYFNKKYDRSGALFQGRYKAQHATEDGYLKYLYAYIHLNPLKILQSDWKEKGLQDKGKAILYLESYPYSSFIDYIGVERSEGCIIDRSPFPEYFQSAAAHSAELFEWIDFLEIKTH